MSCSPHKIRLAQPLREIRARHGAENLLSEKKFRHMLDEQYRHGFENGQKMLREELVQQRQQLIDLQNGVLRSVEKALPAVIADSERAVVLLAMEAARRVVRDLPISAQAVESAVKAGLAELQETAEYEVRLHPEDLSMLEEIRSGLLPGPASTQARFLGDANVPRGGCFIQTRHGSIEATREKMFQKLEAAVLC